MDPPQPAARLEKCAAALALIVGLVGLEPFFSTASGLARLELPPVSVLCPNTERSVAAPGAIGMCLAAAPRLGHMGKRHELQADVGSHEGKLQRLVE
jgi:hypothetical protein